MWRERPEGSVYRAPLCAPVNARRWRTSAEKRGGASLHLLPPVATRWVRRGHAGRRPATLVAADAGNPCQPVSNKASQVKPRPQQRGLAL